MFNANKLMRLYFRIFPMKIMRYHCYRIDKFIKDMAQCHDKKGKSMIDIGAGDCQYKKYFRKMEYHSQDIEQNSQGSIDIVANIDHGLPTELEHLYDYIICTQVLEHLPRPHFAFTEFNRILKHGGMLFLSTHQSFEEHMIPHDYFRFTKYGLKLLGENHGFEMIHIAPHGGIFHILALIIDTIPIKIFCRKGFLYYLYIILFTIPLFFINLACYLFDFLDKDKIMTLNYECIFIKK